MRKSKTPFLSANSLVIAIVMAMLFTMDKAYAASTYIVANGGFCETYADTLPGTLVTYEPCDLWNPKHYSWEFVTSGDNILKCIVSSGANQICTSVGADNKVYLKKKDENDDSQKWSMSANLDQYINYATGPNYCSQAMYNPDGDSVPDYVQMRPCSDNINQVFYLPPSAAARLASHFPYAFYRNGVVPHLSPMMYGPQPILYH